ncbi:MAG TPA: hypothetical protein VGP13_00410 [Candidatus Paceibacterota bacterium]|jgi:hypothetical protein|nr:hypothetical protein [Candidatus Paceibacterota bacterium]
MSSDKHNEGSHMYYKDYKNDADPEKTIKENHETEGALLSKIAAKLRGRAGRLRGKSGTHENNKARGGKMAR